MRAPAVLTEDLAIGALSDWDSIRRGIIMPRYTPPNWFECDHYELTAAGYFREIEVKLTVVDFKRDVLKSRTRYGGFAKPEEVEFKHELMRRGDPRGPVEFSFCCPVGLLEAKDIPPWAGLIELRDFGAHLAPSRRWGPRTVVPAPRLHGQKADPRSRTWALGTCYWRMHHALIAIRNNAHPDVWPSDPPPKIDGFTDDDSTATAQTPSPQVSRDDWALFDEPAKDPAAPG